MVEPDGDARSERRRQILDAAVSVFASRGHHATRIQDVADAAGVAYGLVYHYFGTKDRLLRTVFDENWAIFADVVEAIAGSERPPEDQIRAMLDYVAGSLEAYPDRLKVILLEYSRLARTGEALAHPDVSRVLATLTRAFVDARASGRLVDGAAPEALAVLLLGALSAAIAATLTGDRPVVGKVSPACAPIHPDTVRATVLALFRGVLRAPDATPGA